MRYANGIVAIAEDHIITVDDIRREIGPLVPEIQKQSRSEKEFNEKLEALQEDVVQNLIDRVLIIKDFHSDEKRQVPASYVDNAVSETIITQFDGDRSKYLAYLRSRGISQKDYRKEQEDDMIYGYMRQQKAKSASTISPVKIEAFYAENKDRFYQEDSVQLRLIQVTRAAGDSDDVLRNKANTIVSELAAGADFGDVARKYSQDSRKGKGGDWGWQRRSDLRKEFSDVIFNLEKGQRSEPLIMPEGAFIFFAEDRKHAGILPLDEVRPDIEKALVQQGSRQATERWLEKLRRNAYVKHF
ncbi:peptidyl-prolyl cis-trans isomerase [Opitutus sp. GAS368]|uniref:peptidylprolyl isomerase n=1 Tax=Opitutus sp. GAS368 TaxID=1882749 RepID=UPI001E41BF80|nr:peptidyl-prolyl cis-trans isomerase [Opitutus sp. GAS368]